MMSQFELQPNQWYGWQMIPGYGDSFVPYCCPIRISRVHPLKSGNGILSVKFFNTGYAEGTKDFSVDLKLLHRAAGYLLAGIYVGEPEKMERCAIISQIEFAWLEKFCPDLWHNHSLNKYNQSVQNNVSRYLDAVFEVKV